MGRAGQAARDDELHLHVPGFCEGTEATVESFFDIIREAAAG